MVRPALLAVGALALLGCEPKVVRYELKVVSQTCGEPSPMEGVTHLKFRVTGPGITTPIERTTPLGIGAQEVPEIPHGVARVLEVRGYQGLPATGRVVSIGRTMPFDVPDAVPLPQRDIELAVFLRRVNSFQRTALSVSPTNCSSMLAARAGHTATLMPDGRVLIAGGVLTAAGGVKSLPTRTEYFNPATGAFEEGPGFQSVDQDGTPTALARAFHTASTLADGKVLIAGGESYPDQATPTALRSAALFDPALKQFGSLTLDTARTRHAAAVDVGGRALLVGGEATGGGPVGVAEWYDPVAATFSPLTVSVPRIGARAIALQGGRRLAVVGGSDGTGLKKEILFFEYTGASFGSVTSAAALFEARRAPGVAAFGGDQQLVVAGGYDSNRDTDPTNAMASSELVTSSSMAVDTGPTVTARGELCAVALPDGRAVMIGGRSGEFGTLISDASAELIQPASGSQPVVIGLPNLARARYQHTCTVLLDGTVLVTGGTFDDGGGTPETLQDAYVFTPAPVE